MILPRELKPEKSLYVIGARILKILDSHPIGNIDVHLLYELFLKEYKGKTSFNYFLYGLDWLYILDSVKIKNNKIQKCF